MEQTLGTCGTADARGRLAPLHGADARYSLAGANCFPMSQMRDMGHPGAMLENVRETGPAGYVDSGRVTEVRAEEWCGAARRYWGGQVADSPSAAAAWRGQ